MNAGQIKRTVEKFKTGDQEAFRALYEETAPRAYYTILLIVKHKETAEDLLQDTFMKVVDNIHSYQTGTHFSAWVNTIARNLALSFYQRAKKETIQDVQEHESLFGQSHDQVEEQTYISQLMKHLSPLEQEIVIRHVMLKEKHKDIAKDLDTPLGTITWKYNKALKTLQEVARREDDQEATRSVF